MKTKKWGRIHFPKGTSPILVEVKADGFTTQIEGLGYREESDLEKLREGLERKGKSELSVDQKAEIIINFPKSGQKPVKFSVVGEQPLTPRVIHHPSWAPSEHLVEDIKEEWKLNPNRKMASDTEAMAYLSTASLAAPLSDQYCRIYFYLTRNYLKKKGWKKFGGSMKFLDGYKSLSQYDRRELEKLKGWIFKQQEKDIEERRKKARKFKK